MRCRTPLRAPVMESPVAEAPSGKSYGWIWGVLAVLVLGSFVRTCSRVAREEPRASAAPVDEAAAYQQAFLGAFNAACLKKHNPKQFCDCAGPKVLENFREDEIEGVVEAMKNGKPDVRMSTIIVQCSP